MRRHAAAVRLALAQLALLVALLSGASSADAAVDAERLALQPREVPGLVSAPRRLPAARRALARFAGPTVRRRGRVEAAAFRAGGVRLRVEVIALARPRRAQLALAAWRTAQRRAAARVRRLARVGDAALIVERTARRGGRVLVALRVRRAVALLRYDAPFATADAARLATGYARVQAARLRRALGRTAWDRVLDARRPGGALSTRTALQLFSLLYGPLPGVRVPDGSRSAPPISGTEVLDILVRRRASLTPAQRRAMHRALWGRGAPRARTAGAGPAGGCHERVGGLTLHAEYRKLAEDLRAAMLERLRDPEVSPWAWPNCVYTGNEGGDYATTWWWTSDWRFPPGGFSWPLHPNQCFTVLHPPFFGLTETNRRTILAHEMYHCLRKQWSATYHVVNNGWVEEGLATWAGHQIAPGTYDPDRTAPGLFVKNWLERTDRKGVFGYSYTNFGLFGLIEQEGGAPNLWTKLAPIWRAGQDDAAVFDLATGSSQPDVLDAWGPGLFRQEGWPTGWNQRLPFSRPLAEGAPEVDAMLPVPGKKPIVKRSRAYAADKFSIDGPAQTIAVVSVSGHGRITDGTTEWRRPSSLVVCLGGKCACPPGQHEKRAIPQHVDVTGPLYAGIAAAARPSSLVVEGHALSEYCERDDRPPPDLNVPGQVPGGSPGAGPEGAGAPGGGSNGDPHLRTFDGVHYDFQAAGEFVLARSTQGGFEVQARQEPWQSSKLVSINTQLAFRVGASRVTAAAGTPTVWRVDGRVVAPARGGVALAGGGSLAVAQRGDSCEGTVIGWADGSRACVWSVGSWGVALSISPAESRRGSFVGLLGDFDGRPGNDARSRDGSQLDAATVFGDTSAAFRQLYRVFGESWRATARESLFDYGEGQSSRSFTQRDFPARFHTLEDLSSAARTRAEATCRDLGVSQADALEDCILDLAVTGEQAFAESAAIAEDAAATPTTWATLAGFEHVVDGPLSVLATTDGALHVAAGVRPQRDVSGSGHYASTTIGPDGRQGEVATSAPTVPVSAPLLVPGEGGLRLLAYVDRWLGDSPPGTSDRGVMAWEGGGSGRVADWAPGPGSHVSAAVQTADGTPYTVVVGVGGGHASVVRGRGTGAAASPVPAGESCYATNVNLATDGSSVWAAWLEWDCSDPQRYGLFVAPVNTTTGAIGPSTHAPIPAGATQPLYHALGSPVALVAGPQTGGAWLAYTLDRGGRRHAFLARVGDDSATDLGIVPATDPMLQLAARADGRLWFGFFDTTRSGRLLLRFRHVASSGRDLAPGAWTLTWPDAGDDSLARQRLRLATRGDRLDVVAWRLADDAGAATVWRTQIGP